MTNMVSKSSSPMNGGTAISRTRLRIPATSRDELEAWLYLPEGHGPHPVVVMAHGIGAIKAGGLAPSRSVSAVKVLPQSYSTTASGAALPGSPARSFPFLASLKITARSLAGQRCTPALMRTEFLPGARLSPECISSSLPRRIRGSPVLLAKFHLLMSSLRQGWPRPLSGSGFWQQRY
jgi:hypothetical protein